MEDRWQLGRLIAGVTKRRLKICLRSGREAQDSESLGGGEGDYGSDNHEHRVTGSSDIEQTQPPAGGDFSPDVNGGILDLRPTSQQGKRWNLSDRKDQREILWLIRKTRPKLLIGYGKRMLFCTVLHHEQIRRGAWFLHDLSGDASQIAALCPVHDTLGVQA